MLLIGVLIGIGISASGCQKVSDMKKAAEDASRALDEAQNAVNSQEAGAKMGDAFQKLREAAGGGKVVQAVSFRELKPMLPETIAGMETDDIKGSQSRQMGVSTSKVEGIYRADGEQRQRLTITISDMGTMSGLSSLAQRVQGYTESEMETSNSYERGTEVGGYKGREKFRTYDNGGSSGRVSFMVAERFQVEVDGRNVPMEKVKEAALAVDLSGLEGMKEKGVGVDDGASEKIAEMYTEFQEAEKANEAAAASGETQEAVQIAALTTGEMKALLPAQLAGLARTSVETKSQPMGDPYTLAMGEADYRDGDRQLSVSITDYTEFPTPNGMLPGAQWLMFDMSKESDTGYEKRTTVSGFPALEKLERRSNNTVRCEVQMVVGNRFLLTAKSLNLTMDELKAAIATLNPDAMANMGRAGA
jgi:hypothetical protein